MNAISPPLVIGVGNRARRDDGAGPAVLDALASCAGTNIETVEIAGDCARLIDLWDGRDCAAIVDATQSDAMPGTIVVFDAHKQAITRELFIHTSHAFGVAEAVETARLLDRLPKTLAIWGIEGADFGFGGDLTPNVRDSVEIVAARIAAECDGNSMISGHGSN